MPSDVCVPSPQRLSEDVEHLTEWLSKTPHLPKIDDTEWLKSFLYHNKFSLEKTKSKLENYYSLRSKYPEILKNRDPTAPEALESRKCVKLALAERLSKDEDFVIFIRYETDASTFDMMHYAKRIFMLLDVILLKKENRLSSSILIIDFQNFRYLHALKFIMGAPKVAEILNGAYPERTKGIHAINIPPVAGKLMELMQKHFSSKLNSRVRFHTALSDTLFEAVDRDIVCSDFGGNGPSLAELEERTQLEIEQYRKWFEEQESICSDESLRRRDFEQVEEMRGSFRKLEVD